MNEPSPLATALYGLLVAFAWLVLLGIGVVGTLVAVVLAYIESRRQRAEEQRRRRAALDRVAVLLNESLDALEDAPAFTKEIR